MSATWPKQSEDFDDHDDDDDDDDDDNDDSESMDRDQTVDCESIRNVNSNKSTPDQIKPMDGLWYDVGPT